jgi:hypothetical protein
MNSHKKRGRSRGQRQRPLVVTGEVRLPRAILAWEIDLLKPAIGAPSTTGSKKPTKDGRRELDDGHQA